MRRLTLREVNEQHGGTLPPDAVFRPDEEPALPAAPAKPKRRAGRGQRFAVLNAFTDCALEGLTRAEVKVWLILFRDTKAVTGTARTGQADIARRAGLSRRGVQVALDKLTSKGLVTLVRRGQLKVGPSTYRVHPTGNCKVVASDSSMNVQLLSAAGIRGRDTLSDSTADIRHLRFQRT